MEEDKKITPEPIMKIIWGTWSFKVLHTSVELEIYTKIFEGLNTSKKIVDELDTKEEGVKRLLNACVALKLLTKDGDVYSNTPETNQFLVKDKSTYYGEMILMAEKRDSFKDLKDAILTGRAVTEDLTKRMEDTEHAKIFTRAMHNNAMGPAMVLSKKFDFSKYNKLLDLGGGSGAFSIILTKQYPNLTSTVFDLPKVCSVAKEFINEADAESKVKTLEGDFFKDEYPKDYDIVLLSQILHSWSAEENTILLKKVYDNLPKDGVIIINEFLLDEDKTSPLFPTLFALNMLATSEGGNAYTEKEIRDWLNEIGFEYLETISLTGPVSSIIAKK